MADDADDVTSVQANLSSCRDASSNDAAKPTYLGISLVTELKSILNKFDKKITKGMNETERNAYQFGVSTCLNIIRQITDISTESDFVFLSHDVVPTVYSSEDMNKLAHELRKIHIRENKYEENEEIVSVTE